ncbi:PAS domain S-box protein [Geosporobacter ferrireducens]|uniref:Circadian input-output histidine kinase CikA n=1 Tax=Geosporobacter ferrireducens TaxID=1424294 RepID=A0A1D8GLF2_9FIRM|nr:PAS domain S-box protein [Geosporobacter ferrireducens]AOT71733.1 hypothetical protein Gferi_20665 [Geosporobacter ferrireducens]MTI55514.1 PAS domain S-box protein [Geosporobacter ferrireducens]
MEEGYRRDIEALNDGFWDWNLLTNEVYFSESWKNMLGFSGEEISSTFKEWEERIHPKELTRVWEKLRQHLEGKTSFFRIEHQLKCKDGSYKWVLTRGKVIAYSTNGRPQRIIGILVDRSQQKEMEKRISVQQKNLDKILNATKELVLAVDQDGKIVFANQRFLKRMGYALEALIKQNVKIIHPPENKDEGMVLIREMLRGTIEACEMKLHTRKGETFPVKVKITMIEWNGSPVILGFFRDLTEMRNLKEEISQRKLLQKAVFNSMPCIGWIKDLEGRYMAISQTFEEISGYREEEIIGKKDMDFWQENLGVSHIDSDGEVHQGRQVSFERKIEKGQGSIWLEIFKTPLINDMGNVVGSTGIARDITEKKELQKQLKAAKEEAAAANLAKSQFLANVSHEIRTPLNSIIGFLELLCDSHLNAEQYEYVNEVKSASKSLLALMNTILDFSKIEAEKIILDYKKFCLIDLVEETMASFISDAQKKGIDIVSYVEWDMPQSLMGDSFRLKQVLNHLVENAVKFTDEGAVYLCVKRIGGERDRVKLKFEVMDTGKGIHEEDINKLIEPFTKGDISTSIKYEGTGLGLAITTKILEAMRSSVSVISEVGKGSNFSFVVDFDVFREQEELHELPVQKDMPIERIDKAEPEEDAKKHVKVLLVEDSITNRRMMQKTLEKNGMRCDCAENGQEALEKMKKIKYDIILMDCQMPIMDGYTATKEIRKKEKPGEHSLIIALTANALRGDREKCLKAGMDDYISKPIDINQLFNKINGYLKMEKTILEVQKQEYTDPLYRLTEEIGFEREEAREFLLDYIEETINATLSEIEAVQREQKDPSIEKYIHGLKGTSLNFGLTEVYEKSKKLEEFYHDADIENSLFFLHQIENELLVLKERFKENRIS